MVCKRKKYKRKKRKLKSVDRYKTQEQYDEYKEWRDAVLKRDEHTCQQPGCVCNGRARIEVHHILPWSKNKEERFNVKNGITLCKRAHRAITGKEELFAQLYNLIVIMNESNSTNTTSRT